MGIFLILRMALGQVFVHLAMSNTRQLFLKIYEMGTGSFNRLQIEWLPMMQSGYITVGTIIW